MNYYRRYVGDYLRDTARLSMIEHGAYNLLLDYYYADEQPLPLDHDELYMMVRAMRPDDRRAIDKVLGIFFKAMPDGYHQKRVDHEIEVSKKARSNGKQGGRPPTGSRSGMEPDDKPLDLTGSGTGNETEHITGSGHPPTTNHQPPTFNLQPPEKAGAKRPRGSRMLADWILPIEWEAWACAEQPTWTQRYAHLVADKFRDHWLGASGQTAVKNDWQATWRNWVRKEGPNKINGAGHGKHDAYADNRAAQLRDRADEALAGRVDEKIVG